MHNLGDDDFFQNIKPYNFNAGFDGDDVEEENSDNLDGSFNSDLREILLENFATSDSNFDEFKEQSATSDDGLFANFDHLKEGAVIVKKKPEKIVEEIEGEEGRVSKSDGAAEMALFDAQVSKEIIDKAKSKADDIIFTAIQEANKIKVSAYDEAYKEGYETAFKDAKEIVDTEYTVKMNSISESYLADLKNAIEVFNFKQNELYKSSAEELKDIAISIAEKIMRISLKANGDIIKKMIISAVEKINNKEWAKIYVSETDSELMVEGSDELLKSLSHISKHIKVISLKNESEGTCIIELPDEIIDISLNTQIENIKEIIKNTGI